MQSIFYVIMNISISFILEQARHTSSEIKLLILEVWHAILSIHNSYEVARIYTASWK